jgi:hypothetical protein
MRSTLLILLALYSTAAGAAELREITLRIKDHRFVPALLAVPANVKFRLVVVNEDPTPEEFESHELNREKVIVGKGKVVVFLGPLKPGRYPFFGDFHAQTAQGAMVAR